MIIKKKEKDITFFEDVDSRILRKNEENVPS